MLLAEFALPFRNLYAKCLYLVANSLYNHHVLNLAQEFSRAVYRHVSYFTFQG